MGGVIAGIIFGIVLYTIIFFTMEGSWLYNRAHPEEPEHCYITPYILHRYTEMNWFGCWFVAIFVRLLNPVESIICFLHYICHVGR